MTLDACGPLSQEKKMCGECNWPDVSIKTALEDVRLKNALRMAELERVYVPPPPFDLNEPLFRWCECEAECDHVRISYNERVKMLEEQ